MTGAAPGEVCGVCAAQLRTGARFCGRCGGEQGLMIPREAGVGDTREAAPRARRPRAGRGLLVAVVGYFAMFLPTLVLLSRDALPTTGDLAVLELFVGLVGLTGLAVLGREALRVLIPRAPDVRTALLAVVATAALVLAVTLVARALPAFFFDLADWLPGAGTLTALVYIALIPAVAEELMFRGAVLGGLGELMRDRTALVSSALIFAIAHVSIPSMPHLVALGLILGWVRQRSGSIWPCVLLHAGYNAAVHLVGV